MSNAATKAVRLQRIEELLLENPEGFLQVELARRLGVSRSTITRYLPSLPAYIYIDTTDDHRWKIDHQTYLINLRLNLNEAMEVYRVSRLYVFRMNRPNLHMMTTLQKLGLALRILAPGIGNQILDTVRNLQGVEQKGSTTFLAVLESLTYAWAQHFQTRVWILPEASSEPNSHLYFPYLIEMGSDGNTANSYGFFDPPGDIHGIEIAKIIRVEILKEQFEVPNSIDLQAVRAEM